MEGLSNLLNDITLHTKALERDIEEEKQGSSVAVLIHPTATRLSSIPDLPSTADSTGSAGSSDLNNVPPEEGTNGNSSEPKGIGGVIKDVGTEIYSAGKKASKKVSEMNQKYGVTEKIGNAASATKNKIVEVNENYHITENAKKAVVKGYTSIKNANEKYHVTETVARGCRVAVDKIGSVFSKLIKLPSENTGNSSNSTSESVNSIAV
jgi:hypothetical protein